MRWPFIRWKFRALTDMLKAHLWLKKKSAVPKFFNVIFEWFFASLVITGSLTSSLSFPLINMTNVCINFVICRNLRKSFNQSPHKCLLVVAWSCNLMLWTVARLGHTGPKLCPHTSPSAASWWLNAETWLDNKYTSQLTHWTAGSPRSQIAGIA